MSEQIQYLPVTQIVPGSNHRTHFNEERLQELADSIAAHGLAQPITVRPVDKKQYQIVAGERRYRAISQLLKWKTVPCLVREMTDDEAEVIMGIENLQREDLLPLEEAEIYRRQADKDVPVAEIARMFGVSGGKVKARLALYDLLPEFQEMVNKGTLPLGHAVRMAELDADRQRAAVKWLHDQPGMPPERIFGQYVEKLLAAQQQDSLFNLSFFDAPEVDTAVKEAEGSLKQILPRRADIAPVEVTDTLGKFADQYIVQLLESGLVDEATAVMDFWAQALGYNWMRLDAYSSETLARFGQVILE